MAYPGWRWFSSNFNREGGENVYMINLYGVFYDILFPLLASNTAPEWVVIVIEILSLAFAMIPFLIIAWLIWIPFKIIIKTVAVASNDISNNDDIKVNGGRKPRYRSKKWQKKGV